METTLGYQKTSYLKEKIEETFKTDLDMLMLNIGYCDVVINPTSAKYYLKKKI